MEKKRPNRKYLKRIYRARDVVTRVIYYNVCRSKFVYFCAIWAWRANPRWMGSMISPARWTPPSRRKRGRGAKGDELNNPVAAKVNARFKGTKWNERRRRSDLSLETRVTWRRGKFRLRQRSARLRRVYNTYCVYEVCSHKKFPNYRCSTVVTRPHESNLDRVRLQRGPYCSCTRHQLGLNNLRASHSSVSNCVTVLVETIRKIRLVCTTINSK